MDPSENWKNLSLEEIEKILKDSRSMNIIGMISLGVFILGLVLTAVLIKGSSGLLYVAVAFPLFMIILIVLAIRYRESIKYMMFLSEMQDYANKNKKNN
jgi:hypothetical protein